MFLPAPLRAETVILKDGHSISAPIIQRDPHTLWLKEQAGNFGISVDQISSIVDDKGRASRFDYAGFSERISDSIRQKRYRDAASDVTALVELFPANATLRRLRGMLYQKTGDTAKAVEDYTWLLAAGRADPDLLNNLAVLLIEQSQPSVALNYLNRAVSDNPFFAPAHHNLAEMLLKQGDFASAVREYESVLSTEPDNWDAAYNLGLCYLKLQQYGKAAEQWQHILSAQNDEEASRALQAVQTLTTEGTLQ